MKLVLFDVDGTLIGGLSTELSFIVYLCRRGRLGPRQLWAWLAFMVRWLPRYGRAIGKKNKAYLVGLDTTEVAELARVFVSRVLPGKMCQETLDRLRAHRQAGDHVVLLTGAPDFLAAPLADMWGANDHRAARYASHRGRFVAAPPLVHPYGSEKLRIAQELCALHGTDLQQVVAYADHPTDVRLLEAVGQPVAVGRVLRAIASRRGWELLEGC